MAETKPEDPSAQNRSDAAKLATLGYDEALRTIVSQQSALGELRSRTGLLISAASISTSFLGSTAAKGHSGFPLRFLWAVIPFGVSISLAILVLLPWPGWSFTLLGKAYMDRRGLPIQKALESLASLLELNADKNQRRATVLSILFAVSAIALLWSIIAWIVVIE
jgi:hypothetical protein